MKGLNIDKILSNAKDYHLPIVVLSLLIGSVLQWFHHLDPTYVAFVGVILGAVTGHAFSPAQRDQPADGPKTDP